MKNCPACGSSAAFPARGRGLKLLVCCECGTRRLDPKAHPYRPKQTYRAAYFAPWNMVPGSTAWRQRSATAAIRLDALRALGASGPLLDVGCAGGYLLVEAKARGFEPYGVEISKHAAEMARKLLPGRVQAGTVESARLSKAKFGAITLFDVLEHHPEPAKLLKRLRGLLKSSGLLALTTPDVNSWTHRVMGPFWPHYKEEHLFYPSRAGLRRLLDGAGFRVRWEGRTWKHLSIGFMAPLLRQYPVPLATPVFSLLERGLPRRVAEAGFTVSIGERMWIVEKE